MVSFGERVNGLQVLALLLPVFLAGGGVLLLANDHLPLRLDGIVEAVEEFLIVVPLTLGDALLRGLAESFRVFVAILLDHGQLVLCILLVGDQAGEFEMEGLASGAVRAITGKEPVKEYTGIPVFTGFHCKGAPELKDYKG